MRDGKEREETKNEVMSLLKQTWLWQIIFLSKSPWATLSNGVTTTPLLTWGAVHGIPQPGLAHRGT